MEACRVAIEQQLDESRKSLLLAASVLHEGDESKIMWIEFGEPRISVDWLRAWIVGVFKYLRGGVGEVA